MATSTIDPFIPDSPRNRRSPQDLFGLLSDINQILLINTDLREVFPSICRRLNPVLPHMHAGIALYEDKSKQLHLYAQYSPRQDALPVDFEFPLNGIPTGETYRMKRPIVVDDLRSPQYICETTQNLLTLGRRSGCWVPLQTSQGALGALWITNGRPGTFRAEDALLLNELARPMALALASQLVSQKLAESANTLRTVTGRGWPGIKELGKTATVGVVQCGPSAQVHDANDTFLRIVGLTQTEVQHGFNLMDITPPEYQELCAKARQQIWEMGFCQPIEKEYVRPDGTRVPVLVRASVLDQRGPKWVGFVVDLSERQTIHNAPMAVRRESVRPLSDARAPLPEPVSATQTLHEVERDYISRVLRETNWVVGGKSGAALRLGIKRTTLQYRIKKLEISLTNQIC